MSARCVSDTANQATTNPAAMLPASPRKVRCRPRKGHGRLKNRKPAIAPESTTRILDALASPIVHAKPLKNSRITSTSEPARPSSPSNMLTELMTAIAAKTVNGIAQSRRSIGLVPNRSPSPVR